MFLQLQQLVQAHRSEIDQKRQVADEQHLREQKMIFSLQSQLSFQSQLPAASSVSAALPASSPASISPAVEFQVDTAAESAAPVVDSVASSPSLPPVLPSALETEAEGARKEIQSLIKQAGSSSRCAVSLLSSPGSPFSVRACCL